jgi:predicted TIM-barrel fold metal-dependent hydrolase
MQYKVISADGHIDLPWLPERLFVDNASAAFKDAMPYVVDSPKGKIWVARNGAQFGLKNGMGSAGREYVPGHIHRADRMAETGLYADGKAGIDRLTIPELRARDQDRDGVQAEVLYGILGASSRIGDDAAAAEMMRIYNAWLGDFCSALPERFAGIASIPNKNVEAAVAEAERVIRRGAVRGIEVAVDHGMRPLFDPAWNPLWARAAEANLPVHFHTIGPRVDYDFASLAPLQRRQAFAAYITSFQLAMSRIIMELIYGGVAEAHPNLKFVIGESGIGWIPYVLERMDLGWEDQFRDLTLTMKPSEYWRRRFYATYQSDPIGIRLIDILGEHTIMWGSDFPHPDGVWPDSQTFIARELAGVSPAVKQKIVCDNAALLYGFV